MTETPAMSKRTFSWWKLISTCGFIMAVTVASSGARADEEQATTAEQTSFFRKQVEPILVRRCLECHGSDRKGKLDLRTKATAMKGGESGSAIEPGKPDKSLLYDYVLNKTMPPKKPLAGDEIAVLKRWIERGAYFPDKPLDQFSVTTDKRAGYDWWSFRPLSSKPPPMPRGILAAWKENSIDRFVFAKLAEKGLTPNAPATDRDLIRRVFYDVTGLPPTPKELKTWMGRLAVESPKSEIAYEKLIDELLASKRYGEHWGRHWLDVVRFGESNGFERNVIIDNAWPFRDYVIRSLNEDKPFNQLVLEHLAGDVIAPGDPDVEVGTTFLVCGPYDNVGNQDPVAAAQIRANTIDEIIRATSETFLGLTVGCGRCHNHKFDPLKQADYYGLYATFAGTHHGSREIATAAQKRDIAAKLKPLIAVRERLTKQQLESEKMILARAETKAARYEARWTRSPVSRYGTEEVFQPIKARAVRLIVESTDTHPDAALNYYIDEFEAWTDGENPRNVALAEHGATAAGKSRVAEDFADAYSAKLAIDGKFGARWIANGPELTITFAQQETIRRIVVSSDRRKSLGRNRKATFIGDYRIVVSTDGEKWTEVANSRDRKPATAAHRRKRLLDLEMTPDEQKQLTATKKELAAVQQKTAAVKPLPTWWVGTFQQPAGPFHVFLGGNPQKKGEAVVSASLSTLGKATRSYRLPSDAPEGERRLALARWIVADDNPLTPRVLANRLWHYHFGTGIVDTPSDFGFMGGRPTHPILLDWLARQLRKNGWRLKPLHKQLLMSQTYRQSSAFRADAAKIDADSRRLWRFPPRRLSAEEIRDTMLSVSGKLDLQMGGTGFRLYRYLQDNVATYVPLDKYGPETYRRAVYHQNARAARIDLMTDFDSPDCAFAAPRRSSTTTPLQALTMMNHSFTLDMAGALAERLKQETRGRQASTNQIARAFSLCYSRKPTRNESSACIKLVQKHGLRAFCRVLLNSNEFIYLK